MLKEPADRLEADGYVYKPDELNGLIDRREE